MSTVLQDPRAVETPNYLNQEYGWKSWLFTKDHKRIAVLYIISITAMFFHRRDLRQLDPGGIADATRRPGEFRYLQQVLHHARHRDGLLLPDTIHPGDPGNFFVPMMIGRQRSGRPAHQSAELVHLHRRRGLRFGGHCTGWRGYRLTLHSLQQHLFEYLRHHRRRGRIHRRILVHPDRVELYRHRP